MQLEMYVPFSPRAPVPRNSAVSYPARGLAEKKTVLWHVSSGTLTYHDATSFAHLEKNVVVQSPDQKIRAPIVDLYFTRATTNAPASAEQSRSRQVPGSGAQQISRAVGTGGVIVDQAGRRATAERGEYSPPTENSL